MIYSRSNYWGGTDLVSEGMHITKYKNLFEIDVFSFVAARALRRLIDPIRQPQRRIKEDLGKHVAKTTTSSQTDTN
jgi:hypothetical protein